jgi:hypothetical protein
MTPNEKKHAVNDDDDSTVVTASTTGTSSQVQRRCKVSFSLESNQSFSIPHLDDMDDEEVYEIWFQRKSKLRFSLESNQYFPITHVNDMNDEEYFAIWYEPSDYQRIKSEIFLILRKMMKGEQIEENDRQTVRGLECRTAQGTNLRQQNKLKAMAAVLDEQDRQFDDEQSDKLLAEAYRNATSHCQDEACALGLKDQAELQEELDTMRREPISSLQKSLDSKKSSRTNDLLKQVSQSRLALTKVAHKKGVLGVAA